MTREAAGKRLLVLGAGHFQVPVIRRAKHLGCHVLTLDYLPDNPGHRLADQAFNVSTVAVAEVLRVAAAERIDGVLTYGSDVSAPTVTLVAEALGLPGNPPGAGRILQRKDLFRELQQELGLPHPRFVAAADPLALAEIARSRLPFPAIVKPADSSGSKGQSVVPTIEELPRAFAQAAAFSRCGVVIAEEWLEEDLPELVGDIWIRAGTLAFRQYGHNYFASEGQVRVPVGELVPGVFGDAVAVELDRQLEAIIGRLGLELGCVNFDGLVSRGRVHLLDIGLRNGGNYLPDLIELSTGFDLTAAAIHSALGLDFAAGALHAAPRPAVSYLIGAAAPGLFAGLEVSADLRAHVVSEVMFTKPGEAVEPFTRGDRALGVLLFLLPDVASATALCRRVPHEVRVLLA